MAPWHCDLCGGGDNSTRYRNPFTVSVSGERCAPDDPDIGEDIDDLHHEVSLCDRCARTRFVTAYLLALAYRVEAARLGATPCEHPTPESIPSYYSDTEWCPECGASRGTDGKFGPGSKMLEWKRPRRSSTP